jgi:hypothetical protein
VSKPPASPASASSRRAAARSRRLELGHVAERLAADELADGQRVAAVLLLHHRLAVDGEVDRLPHS